MSPTLRKHLLGGASASVLLLAAAPVAAQTPRYAAGDFHNHTTCTDGVVSTKTMISSSIEQFGLEWLVNAGHGGLTTRDCRLNDPNVDASVSFSRYTYADTIPESAFKGDLRTTTVAIPNPPGTPPGTVPARRTVRQMWRWQNLQEFEYPLVMEERVRLGLNIFNGLEQNVPGHEHSSSAITNGQSPRRGPGIGNDNAMAQFEYLYDRNDNDTSEGGGQGWTGKIPNTTGTGSGTAGHAKSVAGIQWMQANFPLTSYNIPAHLERPGLFSPNSSLGWNIEHLRDWNNAGPTVSFGFESQPGHQAEEGRGSYGRSAVGGGTYGGTGVYSAIPGGVWDGLLGEGRNWFFFASSDWHSRGSFSPFETRSDSDFYPGENQKQYIPASSIATPQAIVDALRSGDAYSVMGDLIGNDMLFQVCVTGQCTTQSAGMGRTLVVPPGASVTVTLAFTQPTTPNFSPYSFSNPLLTPVGINQPLNRPVVDHVDVITGRVTGVIAPSDPNYGTPAGTTINNFRSIVFNPSTTIAATFNSTTNPWTVSGDRRTMTYTIPSVTEPMYVRARGTNIPAGTPFVTDAAGNPLLDFITSEFAPCSAACPDHMPIVNGERKVSFDVRGWANVWFYTNPIFIRPSTSAPLLVETNNNLARSLAGLPPQ